jgi:flagellar M-ring protein FliF
MPESARQLLVQLQEMPPARRVTLAITAAGSLAFFLWLGWGTTRADHAVLYAGLAEDEAARVVEVLAAERVEYRLEAGGSRITVPATQVPEARMRVAAKGLPSGGGSGFELFDQQGFGVTDFVQRVNFRRALQGELARSINQLESVSRSRVQLAMPERSTFVTDLKREASASVVIELEPGAELGRGEVQSIVHLVASSVEGLDAERVTVVDHRGRLLAPNGDGMPGPNAPGGSQAHQAGIERELSERVESLLARTVGPGRVIARVRAELDWTQTETTEERFDPEGQVARSEQLTKEENSDGEAGGIPGLPSTDYSVGGSSTSTRTAETINYEISKSVSRVVHPVGTLKRLHVAVLIDGKPPSAAPATGTEGEPDAPGFVPWSELELQQFEQLARQAVGFDGERGDVITLTSAPFRTFDLEGDAPGGPVPPDLLPLVGMVIRYVGLLVALLLFARLVMGPLLRAVGESAPAAVNLTVGDLEAQLAGSGGQGAFDAPVAEASLAEQVSDVARTRRDESVKALKNWISQG